MTGPSASSERAARPLVDRIFEGSDKLRELAGRASNSGVVAVGRASGSAGALALSYLSKQLGRPVIALCESTDVAERWRRDLSLFGGAPALEFPAWESLFEADSEPDPDTYRDRADVADKLQAGERVLVSCSVQAVLQPVARNEGLRDRRIALRAGEVFPPGELARALVDAGYRRFPQVARPGDFAVRGGIFDMFPRESLYPYRIEFFDDEIESIREFSLSDQRSRDEVSGVVLGLAKRSDFFIRGFTGSEVTLFDRLPPDAILAVVEPRAVHDRAERLIGQWAERGRSQIEEEFWARAGRQTRLELESMVPESGREPVMLPVLGTESFLGSLDRVFQALDRASDAGTDVSVFFRNPAEAEHFDELLEGHPAEARVHGVIGELASGFRWDEPGGGVFLSGPEILGRIRSLERTPTKTVKSRAVDSFLEFGDGDTVVHVTHGIGKFQGVREVDDGRRRGDHLVIEYRDGVQLLVPAERIDLVQKYVGGGKSSPPLDKLGGSAWAKRKARVAEGVADLAAELLEVQALRAEREGHAFPTQPDHEVEAFDAAFPYQETSSQLQAIEDIRADLESKKPMDRLVCGDVGYGKTELAMRAAFKAVRSGKQVAVVVPTTVLAQQHFVTFRDRMAGFSVRIEVLSRLKSKREQREILEHARNGEVDILIGTHRLFSADVSFQDIGLVIIDEEQKFGVVHKERLKQLRRLVDVLTLTATPIPRTLHLSLLGVKDISSLDEAPEGRAPIRTEVTVFDPERLRQIILRELNRDGQVFFLHNRVYSIEARAQELMDLVPEARATFVHGQMEPEELENRMVRFIEKDLDVLVTTTIIESGLDIPSANTLIVERADRFGLSEMHQLRGRVGRGNHQAYAYFLIPNDRPIGGDALERLRAIEEYSALGSGFQIAMRDLEIRGAGNILGKEQSGHIAVVGYDLYCRLLTRAVDKLRGVTTHEPPDVEIAIDIECKIPKDYVPDESRRLRVYRSIATALDHHAVDEIEAALTDQYGPVPEAAARLLAQQRLRVALGSLGIKKLSLEDGWGMILGNLAAARAALTSIGWRTATLPDGIEAVRPPVGTIETFEEAVEAFEAAAEKFEHSN